MQAVPHTSRAKAKSAVALMLTFSAGMVDIVGYLTVYHLFVAHMTGTTVQLGHQLVAEDWADAAKAASILASFVVGSIIGRSVIEFGARKGSRTVASVTLLAEALLILIFVWSGKAPLLPGHPHMMSELSLCLLLAVLALAMGLQTATLTRIGPLTVHTTFVTGMLNKGAQAFSQWLFWIHDEWQKHKRVAPLIRGSRQDTAFQNAQFMSVIWSCYVVGSVAGTWLDSRWNLRTLYLPVLFLFISVAIDQLHPLSIEEEKEQV